jgi:CRP-like cAMP-binding protein
MASPKSRTPYRNKLLNVLSPSDLALLKPDLDRVELPRRKPLEYPNRPFDSVYFVEHGIASIVGKTGDTEVEVGIIGCDGVTGLSVILGNDRSPHSTYIQVSGDGQRLSVTALRAAMAKSSTLHAVLLRYVQIFMVQASGTAVANARATLEERLARWLLMAHDRIDGDALDLTHEFLALMMGTRRPGVTEGIHALTHAGLIKGQRGLITVIDREGLRKRAGKFYGAPEAESKRLIG